MKMPKIGFIRCLKRIISVSSQKTGTQNLRAYLAILWIFISLQWCLVFLYSYFASKIKPKFDITSESFLLVLGKTLSDQSVFLGS